MKDDEEVYVYFFTKEEADERLQQDEETDDVFTEAEWSQIVDKLNDDRYLNHAIWESFHEIVSAAISERKGNGHNR